MVERCMYDSNRLTNNAVRALWWAQVEAHSRRHNFCGVDDLFYAVASETRTSEILRVAGITSQKIHSVISRTTGNDATIDEYIAFTTNAKAAIEMAFEIADNCVDPKIDCIHILCALLSEPIVKDLDLVLKSFNADPEQLLVEAYRRISAGSIS